MGDTTEIKLPDNWNYWIKHLKLQMMAGDVIADAVINRDTKLLH